MNADFFFEYFYLIYFFVLGIIVLLVFLSKWIIKSLKVTYKDYVSLEDIPIEFETIYQELYNNNINSLEKMRKKAKWRKIALYTSMFLFSLGMVFGKAEGTIISNYVDSIITIIGLASMFGMLFLLFNNKNEIKYESAYKNEIVSNFIKLINSQLTYKTMSAECLNMKQDYVKANFDEKNFNRFYPDDYIEGFLDTKSFVRMCDIHIQNVIGNGKNRHVIEVFQGIFALTNCDKDIGTYIKICRNKLKFLKKDDRIEMDSEEFEEFFDVYSENKNLSMRLLTPDIMELLIDFYKKYNLDFEIVFRNNYIYIRFFTGSMFEPKLFGSSMDKQLLFTYYCILKFIVEITKKVNLPLKEIEL